MDLLATLQRDINTLHDSAVTDVNPNPALKSIKRQLFGSSKPSPTDLQIVYQAMVEGLARVMSNSRDSNRELAVDILKEHVFITVIGC